jgi:Glycosyltransferase
LFASVTETQGLTVLEAMAAGTPVVAVGRMGIKDILDCQRGGITAEPDEEEFLQAILRMLEDTDFYLQKKSETIGVAQNWSSRAMADRTLKEYEKLFG